MNFSTGRPTHLPSSDNMNMKMGHSFTPVAPVVDYDPESLVEFFGTGYFPSDKKKPSKDFEVILLSFSDAGDWLFGDDESMDRGLRSNISYGNANGVFVEDFGGYFPVDDFFE